MTARGDLERKFAGVPPKAGGIVAEIVDAMFAEAERIEGFQQALVKAGCSSVPDAAQMRRAELFTRGADMLMRLEPHQAEVRRMLARAKR